MPLLTQSDLGTETYGVANAQTILRHRHDPSLADTLQHKFRGNKGNIKPKIAWRRLRDTWSPGFEDLLLMGTREGWYDPEQPLHRCVRFYLVLYTGFLSKIRLVFHYVFIPWLQSELDAYRDEANDTLPRFNRHKILPHGRPVEIFENPDDYDTRDFAVCDGPIQFMHCGLTTDNIGKCR
jgi:hypothetical protein